LQAGHFNDFIEIGLLRSALFKAVSSAGTQGLKYDELILKVFEALGLPKELYAVDPEVGFHALEETKRAFRSVLGYRAYRDLKRGWRINSPNLEQCGLLEIKYLSLDDLCKTEDEWKNRHEALASASPETRMKICKTLLDYMRRELAIKVEFLDTLRLEQIRLQSNQRLKEPWAIDPNERLEYSTTLYPRSYRRGEDDRADTFLSARSGFGQYLRRGPAFPEYRLSLSLNETQAICEQLFRVLKRAGLVEEVRQSEKEGDVPGYQIPASAFVWVVGDGTRSFHDPIRIPRAPEPGLRPNPFFVEYYKSIAAESKGLEAREHTAQVSYEDRIEREGRFREARLPILYCSPTMELGVDIAELNAVNMRNVPPTPANYAQRSGRAGRSGQPALVFTYCSSYSSHDQYFFKRRERMVSGSVLPPRLDLANEDLIRAHIHAIWLAESRLSLGNSLKDILTIEGEEPSLDLQPHVRDILLSEQPAKRTSERALRILDTMRDELESSDWYGQGWLDEVLAQLGVMFERACDRWRDLYRAANRQAILNNRIIADATRNQPEKDKARRLRAEAESQRGLLTEAQSVIEADFYSYRYFASEGFLPGYNFPCLPLSAYIPGRRQVSGRDGFVSRPRFIAISEFGPRSVIYHEGARYRINRVILPAEDDRLEGDITTSGAKQCDSCGYYHPASDGNGPDLCKRCGASLGLPLTSLFRLQNAITRRVGNISSDEEERLRFGYEIRTAIRFNEHNGQLSCRIAKASLDDAEISRLTYGQAATIWRINLGWRRRANRDQYGFILDLERGYWARNQQEFEDDEDPMSVRQIRVIPYVEDRKNCLLYEPNETMDVSVMASLQAALRHAIQVAYQLEDSELAAEILPERSKPRIILFYEAAEGGAGVLRHLVDDSDALSRVARIALELCHFDHETGKDKRFPEWSKEPCEAACYDCLMSYTNQQDHRLLDRHKIKDTLMELTKVKVVTSPVSHPRAQHMEALTRQCESSLERSWLKFLEDKGLRLPSRAQHYLEECGTRPDFIYDENQTAIYIDGPHHDYPERRERDKQQTECMEDLGYLVIRFGHQDEWEEIVSKHPNIFGRM